MSAESPIILLLEDCPVTGMLIERSIFNSLPTVRLLWARTIEEAIRRAAGLPIELFVLDIGLPDGCGLDFLVQMSELRPSARAIVITAAELPEYQASSAALGVLDFLQKPVRSPELVKRIQVALSAENAESLSRDFSATLRNVTPMDVLQFKCLAGDTTAIEFKSKGCNGTVFLDAGEIVHAETGGMKGMDALTEIVSWKRGKVVEKSGVAKAGRSINCPWQTLLMEVAQNLDERTMAVG